jgi:2-polyprenyl-6-methoxyphenol hydroxylase-like FAD-dependent oxidoreductase
VRPSATWQATPESAIFERAMYDRVPLDELPGNRHNGMVSAGGRVFLLGDAAHAMYPGPGQVGPGQWAHLV